MQILQEQKSALPPTPVNRATKPPSDSCLSYFMLVPNLISCTALTDCRKLDGLRFPDGHNLQVR